MSTITQKGKKSIWMWVLIFVVIGVVVALGVLYYMGMDYISWIGTGLMSLYGDFAAASWVNATLISAGWVALGVLGFYVIKKYFIGEKVTTPISNYTPIGQQISNTQPQDKETVVS